MDNEQRIEPTHPEKMLFEQLDREAQQKVIDDHEGVIEYGDDDPFDYWNESLYEFYSNGEIA